MEGVIGFLKAFSRARGEDLRITSPADCVHKYDDWAPTLSPYNFNPLIPIHGGWSFVGENNHALNALLVGNDWLHQCRDAGAGVKNAILCLAMNYDASPGMVACALEIAMIATKKTSHFRVRLTMKKFAQIVHQVYGNDYAGIYTEMNQKWDVQYKPDALLPPKRKTRSQWRAELGHDVLIHPATLRPCTGSDGIVVEYHRTVCDAPDGATRFSFTHRQSGTAFSSRNFPPAVYLN